MNGQLDNTGGTNRYVSTSQVAKALGISVTSVKRWVDEGILPAHRTVGGHRKLLMADVLRLVRDGNLPQADLSQLVPKALEADRSNPEEVRAQLVEALHAGDIAVVRSLILGAYQNGYTIETLSDRVISPAMVQIGHLWEIGQMQILQEHRATQALVSALYELKGLLLGRIDQPRAIAVGGAPEHDHYILPTLLAKMVLLESDWNAINLGPHTPMSAFHDALTEIKPQMLWISVSHLVDPEKFVREFTALYREASSRHVAVAVGGRGLSDAIRNRIPYTTYGDGLRQLSAFARTIYRIPRNPRRGRPPTQVTAADRTSPDNPGTIDPEG
jgi:MerR family transcriptional regulator, light-induced transcriptional regulator